MSEERNEKGPDHLFASIVSHLQLPNPVGLGGDGSNLMIVLRGRTRWARSRSNPGVGSWSSREE